MSGVFIAGHCALDRSYSWEVWAGTCLNSEETSNFLPNRPRNQDQLKGAGSIQHHWLVAGAPGLVLMPGEHLWGCSINLIEKKRQTDHDSP